MKDDKSIDSEDPYSYDKDALRLFYERNANWFEKITGCGEEEFQKQIASDTATSMIVRDGDSIEIINEKSDRKTKGGKFKVQPLSTYLNTLEEKHFKFTAQYPVLEIITRIDDESAKFVDFAYLQSLPENAGALFQVPSNFNALQSNSETVGYFGSSTFITRYVYDNKNPGPLAALSCGGSAIQRYYCAFLDDKKPITEWAQTQERQISLLENLKEYFPVLNGYVWLTGSEPLFKKKDWKKNLSKVLVAYQSGCEVTSGYAFSHMDKIAEKQIIGQCFVAAMNLSDTNSGKQNKGTPEVEIKSQFLLDAAYLSTYAVAILHQHTQLFLSLVGLDTNNNRHNIYDSIFLAHQKWGRHEHGRLKAVKLIVNELKDVSRSFLRNLRSNNIPYRLTVYTNGVPKVMEKFLHMHEDV